MNVEDVRLLYQRLAPPKHLVVLGKAGHLHFTDGAATIHEGYRQGYLSGAFSDPELQGSEGVRLGEAMRPFSELLTAEHAGSTRGRSASRIWTLGSGTARTRRRFSRATSPSHLCRAACAWSTSMSTSVRRKRRLAVARARLVAWFAVYIILVVATPIHQNRV